MPTRTTFKEALKIHGTIVLPCAHDAFSARMIELAGFEAMAISGSGALAARHALPDMGLAGLADMASIARDILDATSIPCMSDGDDGYGGPKSVVRTVRVNEALGVGALVIEDQTSTVKRPGQTRAIEVAEDVEIALKLSAALNSRYSSDFWIIGRTDVYGVAGLDAALRRADLYNACGVDGLFVAGVRKVEDLRAIGREFKGKPLVAVVYGGEDWPEVSIGDLQTMGYTQIVYPLSLILPMCSVFQSALQDLRQAALAGSTPRAISDMDGAKSTLAQIIRSAFWDSIDTPNSPGAPGMRAPL